MWIFRIHIILFFLFTHLNTHVNINISDANDCQAFSSTEKNPSWNILSTTDKYGKHCSHKFLVVPLSHLREQIRLYQKCVSIYFIIILHQSIPSVLTSHVY